MVITFNAERANRLTRGERGARTDRRAQVVDRRALAAQVQSGEHAGVPGAHGEAHGGVGAVLRVGLPCGQEELRVACRWENPYYPRN